MPCRGRVHSVGLLVELRVENYRHWQMALEREESEGGLAAPRPVVGHGLVDTGAAMSMVRPDVVHALRAMPAPAVGIKGLHPGRPWDTVSPEFVAASFVTLVLDGVAGGFSVQAGQLAFGDAMPGMNVVALIGRDVLAHLRMSYDGPTRTFTLARPG